MPKRDYRTPTEGELYARARCRQLEERIDMLLFSCEGSELIAHLECRITALEAHVSCNKGAHDRCIDLAAEVGRLKRGGKESRAEVKRMKADLAYSYSLNDELKAKLKACERQVGSEKEISHALGVRLIEALGEVARLQVQLKRDPSNSSMSPSTSPDKKKIHNSREKTERKPGAQPGHVGHKRQRHTPDVVVQIPAPSACPVCGGALIETGRHKQRQVVGIKVIVKCTEYVSCEHRCTVCSVRKWPSFPKGAENDVNYDSSVRALPTYLTNCCNVSIDNARAFIYEATGHDLSLSKGFISECCTEFSKAASLPIEDIEGTIKNSPVINSDATFVRALGKQAYIYTYLSSLGVAYQASSVKGIRPLDESILRDYTGLISHDHDKAYYHFGRGHAECNAHILRYLKGVCENEPDKLWAEMMYNLLLCANEEIKAARSQGLDALSPKTIEDYRARYDKIITLARTEYAQGGPCRPKYKPEGINLFTRLDEYEDNHLLFMSDFNAPFSNNAAERALRCAKKKMGQTGGFRSVENGMAPYCAILTVAQTAKIRGLEVLTTMIDIFDGKTDMFKITHASE